MRKCALVALGLALVLGQLAALPASADESTGAAAPPAASSTVAQASSDDAFPDVPENHWAYQAIQELANDGYIKGYPDGTFKGNRPMTRYEVAALIERAVSAIKSELVAGNAVSQSAIDALTKLVNAQGLAIKDAQGRIGKLEAQDVVQAQTNTSTRQQIAALKKEADATDNWVSQGHFGIGFDDRLGTAGQDMEVNNGPYAKAAGAAGTYTPAVLANSPFPTYYGGVPGNTRGSSFTFGPGATQSSYVGPTTQGTNEWGLKALMIGNANPWLDYDLRVSVSDSEGPAGTVSAAPATCTSAISSTYSCSYQDLIKSASSLALSTNIAWLNYSSPGGFSVKIGKQQINPGYRMFDPIMDAGNTIVGVNFKYRQPGPVDPLEAQLALDLAPSVSGLTLSQTNTQAAPATPLCTSVLGLNAGTQPYPLNLGINPYCNQSPQGIVSSVAYFAQKTGTTLSLMDRQEDNIVFSYWAPQAGLCATSAANQLAGVASAVALNRGACQGATPFPLINASGAYINAQGTINYADATIVQDWGYKVLGRYPQWGLELDYLHRFGTDPFTGGSWVGPNTYHATLVWSQQGNLYNGGPGGSFSTLTAARSGMGPSNYIAAGVALVGMNSEGPIDGPFTNAQTWQFNSTALTNLSGMQLEYLTFGHWWDGHFHIAIGLLHLGTLPGVTIPAGATSCPGCYVNSWNSNAGFINFSQQYL
jgi:hypothetical protein